MSEDDSVKHEGKWTRADLPSWVKIREADDMAGNGLRSRVIDIALNEVVEHLNAHHPKPDSSGVGWKSMYEHELRNRVAAVDLMRRERDEAWRVKGEMVEMAVRAERERDAAVARVKELEPKVGWVHNHSFEDGPCNEIRLADGRIIGSCQLPEKMRTEPTPTATKAEVGKVIREALVLYGVAPERVTDAAWSLLSGSDPAVYVVRESDIATVEVEKVGARIVCGGQSSGSPEASRIAARNYLQKATDCEAMARELEDIEVGQNVDPVEDVAHIISAGMFHKESGPELVREIAQEVVDYLKGENDG